MTVYKCQNPNCGKEHESLEPIAFCSFCGTKLIPFQRKAKDLPDLSSDSSLWAERVFNDAPAIIAHEYWRLQQECHNNNPFPVMLQIRDVMEVLLKFEVLAVCAYSACARMEDFNKDIGCQIARPTMTMGAWHSLANSIVKYFTKHSGLLPNGLLKPLKSIQEFYRTKGFVNWRNETIGHGAMGFAEDEKYIIDIQNKLSELKALFDIIGDDLVGQKLYVLSDQHLFLRGHDMALDIKTFDQDEIRLQIDDLDYSISPYILIRDRGLYFFDTQSGKTTKLLNYTSGSRRTEKIDFFIHLSEEIISSGMNSEMSVDDQFLTEKEDSFLNQFGAKSSFVKPKHLIEWVQKMLKEHDKGVFTLMMARGMGKSTFSEKVNCLYPDHLILHKDLDVRTYHLSRTQLRHNNDLERTVENLWAINGDGALWTGYKRIIDFRNEGYTPKEAFAEFLNQARRFTEQNVQRGQSRILMVLDGLDEIAEDSIWDYIPDADMLDKGVYLLMTSRDPKAERDLPSKIVEHLLSLSITDECRVDAKSISNQAFLQIYLNHCFDDKMGNIDGKQKNRMIELAQNRILDLQLLCKMIGGGMSINELPDNSRIVQAYVGMLKKKYGPRRFYDILRVISAFCTFGRSDPLSLRGIAMLCNAEVGQGLSLNNDLVTFELLGILNDLNGILKVERSIGLDSRTYHFKAENQYSLANPDYAQALIDCLPISEDRKWFMSFFNNTVRPLTPQEILIDIEKVKGEFKRTIREFKRDCLSYNEMKLSLRNKQQMKFLKYEKYIENLCEITIETSGQWDRLKQDYALWKAGRACNSMIGEEWLGRREAAEGLSVEEIKKFLFDIRDGLCLGITYYEPIPSSIERPDVNVNHFEYRESSMFIDTEDMRSIWQNPDEYLGKSVVLQNENGTEVCLRVTTGRFVNRDRNCPCINAMGYIVGYMTETDHPMTIIETEKWGLAILYDYKPDDRAVLLGNPRFQDYFNAIHFIDKRAEKEALTMIAERYDPDKTLLQLLQEE